MSLCCLFDKKKNHHLISLCGIYGCSCKESAKSNSLILAFLLTGVFVVVVVLQQYRGCFGCCNKPPLIVAVDEPSKGLRIQGRLVKKPSVSDDFWSTSTCEMDNSTLQSQRSMSSISFTNNTSTSASTSNPTEFVNHGELTFPHIV